MLHLAAPCCAMARLLEGSRLRLPGRREQRPLEFGHFEDRFQDAARSVARAIGEEESKKSTRLSEG